MINPTFNEGDLVWLRNASKIQACLLLKISPYMNQSGYRDYTYSVLIRDKVHQINDIHKLSSTKAVALTKDHPYFWTMLSVMK